MAEKVAKGDFIKLDYTGKLADGVVFDTTDEKAAKDAGIYSEKRKFGPTEICIGEGQLLPGLDAELEGKEIGQEFTVTLQAENAFGKRDVKKVKIVPLSTFKEHKLQPQPGLQINVDGELGTIKSINGGRVIVNFNHPLAGREVVYTATVVEKITDPKEKILSFLQTTLQFPKETLNVTISDEKATVEAPMALPPQFTDVLTKKLSTLTGIKKVEFAVKKQETQEKK